MFCVLYMGAWHVFCLVFSADSIFELVLIGGFFVSGVMVRDLLFGHSFYTLFPTCVFSAPCISLANNIYCLKKIFYVSV